MANVTYDNNKCNNYNNNDVSHSSFLLLFCSCVPAPGLACGPVVALRPTVAARACHFDLFVRELWYESTWLLPCASSLFRQRKLFDGARHAIRRHTGYLCRIATILNTCSYFHIILVRKHGLYAAASNSDACQGCLSRAFGSFYFASNFHPLFLHLKLFTNIFFYKWRQ